MTDTTEPTTEPATEPAIEPTTEPATEPEVTPPTEPAKPDLDLEGATAALKKAREEAAATRVKLREIEQKYANAKTPEEVDAITNELKAANEAEARSLLVENVALKFGLPADLAAVLTGSDREALEKHAEVLAKYAPSTEQDDPHLAGGLTPGSKPTTTDTELAKEMAKLRTRRY